MKIILAGATGLVGHEVLDLLLKDSRVAEIIVYSRRPLNKSDPRLKVILGDLGELRDHQTELQGDVFISCLGTTIKTAGSKENFRKVDFDAIVEFAKIAKSHSAKKFILVSAQGANASSPFFYPRVKGETEEALKQLSFPALTIMRPSLLVGDRDEKRPGEEFAIKAYRLLSGVLPESLQNRLGTRVSQLAAEIVEEAMNLSPGTHTRSPADI